MAIEKGQQIGRYRITAPIGRGGMAEVYTARDTRLDTDVAIKFIRTDRFPPDIIQGVVKRFQNEAKKMAQLSHPNIVKVTDYGKFNGIPFLVMDHLPGGTLKKYLGKAMPYQEAVKLLLPIANALAYAHAKGVIHRDVKPANILISDIGQPMLSDFGVAKIVDSENTQGLTATGAAIGTPEYMAPEQAVGKEIDERVDIYSLGVILYELITGRRPYSAETPMQVIIKQSTEPLPPPSQFVNGLPKDVEQVLQKALEKDPEKRFDDMYEFADILDQLESEKRIIKRTFYKRTPPKKTEPKIALSKIIPFKQNIPEIYKQDLRIGSTFISEKDCMTMVFVPAGNFLMGSTQNDSEASSREKPQHSVYLDAYWIDKTPVTNAMFAKFLNEINYTKGDEDLWLNIFYSRISQSNGTWKAKNGLEDHPMVYVTWYGAQAYSMWAGRRLPTEAEWEKAARGKDGRIYPWGTRINHKLANYEDSVTFSETSPVDFHKKGASPYGALDMAGNAWEWVNDWFDEEYYKKTPYKNPQGPTIGDQRCVRGGSWYGSGWHTRSAYRCSGDPDRTDYRCGFRCALSQ